jgi:hypothetical protein
MASDSAFLMNPAYAVDFAHTYSSSGVKFTYLRGVIRPAFAMGEGNDRLSKSNLVGHEEATWSILARETSQGQPSAVVRWNPFGAGERAIIECD